MNAARRSSTSVEFQHPISTAIVSTSTIGVGERRLEAESYLTAGYELRRSVERLSNARLSDVARIWQPSRLKGIQVQQVSGRPFLAATQVFDVRPAPRKWLAANRTPDLNDRVVQAGWILVTCSGSVGDTIMAYEALNDLLISHDLLRVIPQDDRERGFVYAYLRTIFARGIMRSSHYGNIIKHLEPEHLAKLPVPTIDIEIKELLEEAIQQVYALRTEARRAHLSGEAVYSSAIGPVQAPVPDLGYEVRAEEMFFQGRRLDAYSHSPHAGAVVKALRATKKPIVALKDVSKQIYLPNRFSRGFPSKNGIWLVGTEELFQINPHLTKLVSRSLLTSERKVQRNWLLVARSGQIYGLNGSVAIATVWHEDKLISDHTIRVVPGDIRPGYLLAVLGHPVLGRPLILREVYGTSVPEIDPVALGRVPVVRLGELETEIADEVERAAALRVQADEIENAAVTLLEIVISNKLGTETSDRVKGAAEQLESSRSQTNSRRAG